MLAFGRVLILIAGLLFLFECAFGQTVTVKSITIHGLKRTKASIVYRELTFKEGDSIPQADLGPVLERSRNNLLNMGIFNEAIVNISEWDTKAEVVDISIEVKESWYIYAMPILELADRNFNVWWTTYNHAFNRLNLGARLDWLNFTGRNDRIKAKIQFGYTPKQELDYRFPYLNKRQSLSISTGFNHSINKEISYITEDNREQFVQLDERVLQERWQGNIRAFYRPSLLIKYELALGYQYLKIDEDIVKEYNPVYFSNGDSTHSVFSLRGVFEYDDRDIKLFPARGIKAAIEFEKIGLTKGADENLLISFLTLEVNIPTGRRFQHRFSSITKYSFSRSRPSQIYYRGLGSGVKYVTGYELYIVDGLDFTLGKYQFAYKLVEKQMDLGDVMPIDQFRKANYAIYLSLLAETGYSNDPYLGETNPLANEWLYGFGGAATLMLYNNFLFQFSYSVNHLGEAGFFIHNRTSF
jgi:outer membrane protein assembly factor BamA